MFTTLLEKLQNTQNLNQVEANELQSEILTGNLSTENILEVFQALDKKPLTNDEFLGFSQASIQNAKKIDIDFDTFDIVGTGGDKIDTFNISTISMFIIAACGVPVTKHGNRASTSKVGSADILEEVGIKIDLSPEQAKIALEKTGAVFLFAPVYHSAFRFTREARLVFAKKTYFNLLGPVLNPTLAKYSLIGLADNRYTSIIGETMKTLGSKKAWLTTNDIGINEISPIGQTNITEFASNSNRSEFQFDPAKFGFDNINLEDIKSADREQNAQIFINVLQNKGNHSQMASVIINSAASLIIFGKTEDWSEAIFIVKEALESGKAWKKFIELRDLRV